MESKKVLTHLTLLLAFLVGCVVYQQQQHNGSSVYPRLLEEPLPIPADFQTQFPDAMTQQLTQKLIGYWVFNSCTNVLDPSITFEYEVSATNGLDAAVLTVVSDEDPSKKYAVLAFLGSNEIADWLINFDSAPVDPDFGPSGMEVYGGYYKIIWSRFGRRLVREAMKLVTDMSYEDTLYVIGHSAGGGYSNVVGPFLAEKYPTLPVKVITWGAPRGGNAIYKDFVNSLPNLNFWRFVYQDDPVPRFPPPSQSFFHAGHLVDINENDAKAYYQQTGNNVYAGVPSGWDYEIDPTSEDHAFIYYCDYYNEYVEPTEFQLKPK